MVKNNNDIEACEEEDIYGEGAYKPMKHSTIVKLRKLGRITDKDVIGGMLRSETARDLYKHNIRVHHKHYSPNDKRKYFHDNEITGGKINIGKAFKKFGSTIKHTYNKAVEGVKDVSNKVVKGVTDYTNVVLHGRKDYPPKVRQLIKQYGDKQIVKMTIDRTPVPSLLTGALNAVSMGAFNERFSMLPYDKLFHLRVDLQFTDSTRLAVEKNEVINMYERPKKLEAGEQKEVSGIPPGLTLNHLLEGGQRIQGGNWFKYSAYDNNCQDFILALLNGSNIGNEQDRNFIKQDTSSLFKGDSFLRKFANTVTDIGSKVNEITTGAGIYDDEGHVQSVVFDKDNWTVKKAIKWLMKHGYDGLDVDEKPNTLRFRQIEPSDRYHYITKSLPNEVELVIAYKSKLSNNEYNNMPSKQSIKGCGGKQSTQKKSSVAPEPRRQNSLETIFYDIINSMSEDRREAMNKKIDKMKSDYDYGNLALLMHHFTRASERARNQYADDCIILHDNLQRETSYRSPLPRVPVLTKSKYPTKDDPPLIDPQHVIAGNRLSEESINLDDLVDDYSSDNDSIDLNELMFSSSDDDSEDDKKPMKKIGGGGLSREKKIVKQLQILDKVIKHHQRMHGGKINIGKAFKKLGSTIKSGLQKEVINPIKSSAKKEFNELTKPITSTYDKAKHFINSDATKTGKMVIGKTKDYVTKKKGGLLTDVIKFGIPAATGAAFGGLATLATGGNPVAGVAASALGSKLGSLGAQQIRKHTGTGMRKRGRPRKSDIGGDLVHIDIGSHNARRDIEGDGIVGGNVALMQLLENYKKREDEDLKKSMKKFYKERNEEITGLAKKIKELPKYAKGMGLKKGSPEMKERMARIRAMRKN
jgi:hypothetical protein